MLLIKKKKNVLFIYFWLCWVFTAAARAFSLQKAGATLGCGVQASHCGGFPCCRAQALGRACFRGCSSRALGHRLNSCGAPA